MVESEGEQEAQRSWEPSKIELVLSVVFGVLFVVEIIACFFLFYDFYSISILLYTGWVILILGFIMMSIPRYELSKKGGVPEGKSWVKTTVIVETGIYGIVRHPLYVGWLLTIFAMMFISQHWIPILLGVLPFTSVVYYVYIEDSDNKEKFGPPYAAYSMKVPMMNFVLGLIRYRRRNRMNSNKQTE